MKLINKIKKLQQIENALHTKIGALIRPFVPENVDNVSDLMIYYWFRVSTLWECEKSPMGFCMYDHNADRAHDNCLFCHEPEERK